MLSIQNAGGRRNITIFHLDIYGHTLKEHRKSDGHQLDAWTDGHPGEHDYVGLAQARPNYCMNYIPIKKLVYEYVHVRTCIVCVDVRSGAFWDTEILSGYWISPEIVWLLVQDFTRDCLATGFWETFHQRLPGYWILRNISPEIAWLLDAILCPAYIYHQNWAWPSTDSVRGRISLCIPSLELLSCLAPEFHPVKTFWNSYMYVNAVGKLYALSDIFPGCFAETTGKLLQHGEASTLPRYNWFLLSLLVQELRDTVECWPGLVLSDRPEDWIFVWMPPKTSCSSCLIQYYFSLVPRLLGRYGLCRVPTRAIGYCDDWRFNTWRNSAYCCHVTAFWYLIGSANSLAVEVIKLTVWTCVSCQANSPTWRLVLLQHHALWKNSRSTMELISLACAYMSHRGLNLTWAEVCRQSSRTLGEGWGTWAYVEWCSLSANIREFICQHVRINHRTQNRSSRIIDWRCTHIIRT